MAIEIQHPLPAPGWEDKDLADPHAAPDKAARVRRMFSAIAGSYDWNNHLHSLWLDQRWRRAAVRMAGIQSTDIVADIACGTGDLSLAFDKAGPKKIIGIDFCRPMLLQALKKTRRRQPPNGRVSFHAGDALRLPLADRSADVVSIAFGIRNVADWRRAIDEFHRVLRPGGRLIILEFSLPESAALRGLYNFYFQRILPRTATWLSGDKTGAYRYLPQSVHTFINRDQMMEHLGRAGFAAVSVRSLTCGVCLCYQGVRHA
jgi:demethylmenaquinone methyltransferase/2-methoxy-6-polyprenyl-1,4-benzoquinol methylase